MELRQLRYFLTVAEELHFGRAAERLHIVQSAVSQQVRRLERDLGCALFDRSARQVRLSPEGLALLPHARGMLLAEERARSAVAAVGSGAAVLRLGTSSGMGDRLDLLLDALASRDGAGIRTELVSLPVQARVRALFTGRLDAAFVRAARPVQGLTAVPVWHDEVLAALPAAHPAAADDTLDPARLATLPLRLTTRRSHPALVDLVTGACRAHGFEPVTAPAPGSLHDTLAAVGGGPPSWTVVYASQARQLHTPRVTFRPLSGSGLWMETSVLAREDDTNAAVRRLLGLCAGLTAAEGPRTPAAPPSGGTVPSGRHHEN
ncbi:LysR family transcriptional regulator [Streptomyces sp. NPDC059785]|uniref:LysR family transcriptional regulator n=1 Tax=unclassified Streptomyces TaxID=2593676 RepID=UPI00364DD262